MTQDHKPTLQHLPWSHQACLYSVNIRQFTPEGTFSAFEAHLPRLKAMGVTMLWLMPVQPIGQAERKGGLGSYYSIADYTATNPEFGSLAEFKALVAAAHAHGMKVLIDWVANHTAWDHPWVAAHPDWYKKDARGAIHAYTYDNGHELEYWTDVVGLDYGQSAVWPAMIDAMRFWLVEADVDGFRCDVAGLVPTDFWVQARASCEQIKPVFMLAEWSDPELHRQAFDMSYHWALRDTMTALAQGRCDVNALARLIEQPDKPFGPDDYRMCFTNNHDINAWIGHDGELYGAAFPAMAVLAATWPGMPLIYGGQEAWLDKRLAFFEKDAIDWRDWPLADFYRRLIALKHDSPALWNGLSGGPMALLVHDVNGLFAYRRRKADSQVVVLLNLSNETRTLPLTLLDELAACGAPGGPETLEAWSWKIWRDASDWALQRPALP